jgi:signal transduction histidine kinase/ligand-binding sensor domain-containing protein
MSRTGGPQHVGASCERRLRVPLSSRRLAGALLCLGWLAACSVACAQFRSTQWTADSGLPQNIVRGIVQTPDGYLWIATLNGVARFDGVRFVIFDKSNSRGITGNRFAAIVKGEGGDLWLGGEDGSLTRYHQGQFTTLIEPQGVPPHSVGGLTADANGGVWILRNGTIFQWHSDRDRFEPIQNDDHLTYSALAWVGTGFWAIKGQQLICFVRGQLTSHPLPTGFAIADIKKVAVGWDGVVWFDLSGNRMGRLTDGEMQEGPSPMLGGFKDKRHPWKVMIDGTLNRSLLLPSEGSEKPIQYNAIIEDDEHNLWVGSEGRGLFRVQEQTMQVYSTPEGLAGANVYPVFRSRTGDMWVGTWPAGLTQFHEGKTKTYTAKDGLPGLVTSLAEDEDGKLWIGTHGGLATLWQEKIQIPPNLPRDLPVVQAIFKPRGGTLMLGTPNGIYLYDGESGSWLHPPDGIPVGDVRVIIQAHNGDLWFAGYGGLARIHGGSFTRWTEHEGLPSNNVRSLYEDSDGVLWVGTYDGGLGRFASGKWTIYNRSNGLFDNGAFQILEDAKQNLWMSSNRGIYRVSKRQLADVAAGRLSSVIAVSYGRSDGMLNVECNGGLWPAGAQDTKGRLWFPTQEGVAVVDPAALTSDPHPPRVLIESASLDHLPANILDHLTIKPSQGSLEIQYTALSFSRPEQLTFRYKMDGLEDSWEEAGYRRTAYFSHLPPGNYTFRVEAANNDGVWSTGDTKLPISVLPPFYRSWWFIACICALALASVWAIGSYRIRQLKATQAAQKAFSQELIASQENERRRIAAELHDSLGQRLIVIKNLALFLLRPRGRSQNEEDQKQTIEEISTEASFALDETRSISYDLRPFQLDRLGLTKAIESLVRTASRAAGIPISAEVADIDDVFAEHLRINFYRIVQEALNNILKHSHATQAQVVVRRTEQSVRLMIRDNGDGLHSEQKAAVAGPGGFGLTGMRERAALLEGRLNISSKPGNGTQLIVDFHMNCTAYPVEAPHASKY